MTKATEADLEHVLRNNFVEKSDHSPGPSAPWKHVSGCLRQPATGDALAALVKPFLAETLGNFARRAGVGPRFVTLVALRGEWLRVSLVPATPAGPFTPAVPHPLAFLDSTLSMTAGGLWLEDGDFPAPVPGCKRLSLADSGPEPPEPEADEPVTVTTSHG